MITGNLQRINGDFSVTNKLKEYVQNPIWQEDYTELWGLISGATDGIGRIVYEHVANFVQNVRDIDTCGLHQLYSLAKELNVEQIFSYDLKYPGDLGELMDILSINKSYLLTSGYILTNDNLKSIYNNLGINISGNKFIYDETYISAFLEPIISANLIQNSSYTTSSIYSGITLDYQGFMDDIYSDPNIAWNSTTSGMIISECTHTLRNIAIRASYQRETLKTIAQKHAMIGTTKAIEKIIGEYILRSFTKKDDWRLYVNPSGSLNPTEINNAYVMEQSLPRITDVNTYFGIDVVEYWDNTEYLNISAMSPLVCGLLGYTTGFVTTANVDVSGNYNTGSIISSFPYYGTGLCGYVVTGGNPRFWEGDYLNDSINISDQNSAILSAYYKNIGLTGNLNDNWNFSKALWNIYSVSGLNRLSVIPDLTGSYINNDPNSGWNVYPTSLSSIHYKYIGNVSGDTPQANYKNQLYPTMSPTPFIWNLVEKVYEDFPEIIFNLLPSQVLTEDKISGRMDSSGNIIDSWRYYNHEYIGYQTYYEQSANLDFNDKENPNIDRDGSFHADCLSAYLQNKDISSFYSHILKDFTLSGSTPRITDQLVEFRNDIEELSGKLIYQYAFDQNDHHYMLYKDNKVLNDFGALWMRYRNHPLPFPLSYGTSNDYMLQQLYIRGGMGLDLDYVVNGKCYDFGFIGDIMWVLGQNRLGNDIIYIMHNDYVNFPYPIDKELYSVVVKGNDIPLILDIGNINKYIGLYNYNNYIIFVYVINWTSPDIYGKQSVNLKFKHYNKYTRQFENTILENVTINNLPSQYTPIDNSNVWRLAVSEKLVSMAYESINNDGGDYINNITTIDLEKNILDGSKALVWTWNYVIDLE